MKTLKLYATTYELPYWDLLPPLPAALFAELKQSIKEDGQQVPILLVNAVGKSEQPAPRVIDGGHRLAALCELAQEGIEVRPYFRTAYNLTPEKERQLALDLNLKRRQLSTEERKEVVLRLAQEGQSLRSIAAQVGVTDTTVRRDLAGATYVAPETVTGRDGKEYPATRLLISQPNERTSQSLYDEAEARRDARKEKPSQGAGSFRPESEAAAVSIEDPQDQPPEREVALSTEETAQEIGAASSCGEHPVFIPTMEIKKGVATIQPSGFDGWNTPPGIIALLNAFALFGRVSLDPCSNEHSQVNAHVELDLVDDGLNADWAAELQAAGHEGGLVFVNPPYDQETLEQVAQRINAQAAKGLEIIALVPVKSDQAWWQDEVMPKASALCCIRGRVKFWEGGEQKQGAAHASALIYWGKDAAAFCGMFGVLGRCLELSLLRESLRREAQAGLSEEEAV